MSPLAFTTLALLVTAFAPPGVAAHERGDADRDDAEPKVAVIVGPAGDNSDDFRAVGDEAVREALKYTVVRKHSAIRMRYSPRFTL